MGITRSKVFLCAPIISHDCPEACWSLLDQGEEGLRVPCWRYACWAIADVEANYLAPQLRYRYTLVKLWACGPPKDCSNNSKPQQRVAEGQRPLKASPTVTISS